MEEYPLSTTIDRIYIIDDNKQTFPRLFSSDSGVSFGESDNDSILSSEEYEFDFDQQQQQPITITNDVYLASTISDDEKKFFCENTAWAWHGEFGRLIMATAMKYNLDYRLMLYEARSMCPRALNAHYFMIKSENAKAQFKCQICGHCWTSMRARCSFYISKPNEGGIVLLRLYSQQCQYCHSIVYPLWYYDEICRVMKSLAMTVFEHCFPYLFQSIPIRRLYQRQGHMRKQHNPLLCEACRLGVCY